MAGEATHLRVDLPWNNCGEFVIEVMDRAT
jgi:hypothetical protein